MKNSIRRILESGGVVSYPHKTKINQWYGTIKISLVVPYFDELKKPYYYIDPLNMSIEDINEAIDVFMEHALTSKNIGLVQDRLAKKGINFEDDYDLEHPKEKEFELFKTEGELLDKEYNRTHKPIKTKERINYIRDGEHFVGHPVNIKGVVIQAKSLDELKSKAKVLCRMMLDVNYEIVTQDDPFELVEETDEMIWLYGEQDAKVRKELQKYKDIFGEI